LATRLTTEQLMLVQRAASTLPVTRRDEFLRAVAARLGDRPSTPAVELAISLALHRKVALDGTA
jgi:hypothetical protein